jgi:hypothetical protein
MCFTPMEYFPVSTGENERLKCRLMVLLFVHNFGCQMTLFQFGRRGRFLGPLRELLRIPDKYNLAYAKLYYAKQTKLIT